MPEDATAACPPTFPPGRAAHSGRATQIGPAHVGQLSALRAHLGEPPFERGAADAEALRGLGPVAAALLEGSLDRTPLDVFEPPRRGRWHSHARAYGPRRSSDQL